MGGLRAPGRLASDCCRKEMEATAEQGTMKKLRILTTSPMRTSCSSLNNYSTIHPNPYSSYYKDCLAFRDDSVDFVSGRVSESIASLGEVAFAGPRLSPR